MMKLFDKLDYKDWMMIFMIVGIMFTGVMNILTTDQLSKQNRYIEEILEIVQEQSKLSTINRRQNNSMLMELTLLQSDIDLLKAKVYED